MNSSRSSIHCDGIVGPGGRSCALRLALGAPGDARPNVVHQIVRYPGILHDIEPLGARNDHLRFEQGQGAEQFAHVKRSRQGILAGLLEYRNEARGSLPITCNALLHLRT